MGSSPRATRRPARVERSSIIVRIYRLFGRPINDTHINRFICRCPERARSAPLRSAPLRPAPADFRGCSGESERGDVQFDTPNANITSRSPGPSGRLQTRPSKRYSCRNEPRSRALRGLRPLRSFAGHGLPSARTSGAPSTLNSARNYCELGRLCA